ncbi:enolase-phosphatase E1-like [Uloborus diversus]|uniref:enolase-phosphatase E1-like n=1 Tax=Uloborus diversus TaxID=327109 RepID=UPI002409D94A|nr:enolase-phosphatase E1-like [Uloborus diversus]
MAVSKQPAITPETSSGEGLDEEPTSRGEAKWKRFHPLRVVRKIFRRRVKRDPTVASDTSKKSWSTSELQSVQDDNVGKCDVTSPLKLGLSVSHDSIFSPESNANVGSEEIDVPRGSSLSVRHTSMKNMFKDELFTRIRARRDSDDDDDDVGLPHSPCTSPTTVDVLSHGFKEKSTKSHSSYSAGSLISMGSSENDDDSAGHSSGHSSRMSLLDRRSLDSEGEPELSQSVPLNHNAAHHKIAVRPKRTYGLPRRRMNQIAAAKVNPLPSTPEVTEDHTKSFSEFNTAETIKAEYSSTFIKESSDSGQSEFHLSSHMESSYTCKEITAISKESKVEQINEDLFSETSHAIASKRSADAKTFSEAFHNGLKAPTPNIVSKQEVEVTYTHKAENVSEYLTQNASCRMSGLTQNFSNKCHDEPDPLESFKLVKNSLQEEKSDIVDNLGFNQSETNISVSSLVKNIEQSDTFKTSESTQKQDESKSESRNTNYMHETNSINKPDIREEEKFSVKQKSECIQETEQNIERKMYEHRVVTKQDELKAITKECFVDTMKKATVAEKLDVDSEFILKPIRKDMKQEVEPDLTKETAIERQEENLSHCLEEESIMSNKSLKTGLEESRIFISHHSSFDSDLKDMLVTETHNFATVEDKSGISVQTPGDRTSDTRKSLSEHFISAVGISTSTTPITDVTVSSTSTLCDNKLMEDKITISVNSKPKQSSHRKDSIKSIKSEAVDSQIPKLSEKLNQDKVHAKEKNFKPSLKSHLPEVNSSSSHTKTLNSQKRVSVEIVPFSQRMKERKYQPISFANKESPDIAKKNTAVSIERKLSDRKVTTKNKELDKSNNRHSFSGALTTESKREGDCAIAKKITKTENVQYPVQIRIHKTVPKPEIKEKTLSDSNVLKEVKNTSSEVKFQMQSSKLSQTEMKATKDEKRIVENTAKWEIKIQPSVSPHSTPYSVENDESSPLVSENSVSPVNEMQKLHFIGNENKDQLNLDQSNSIKNQDNSNWKSPKESPAVLSDDPEPELLRVFARRSIKQKHCDKEKNEEKSDKCISDTASNLTTTEKGEESSEMISISHNSTVIKISEISKPHIMKPDLKKKSKSFCEKDKVAPRAVSPLKEMNLIRKELPAKVTATDSSNISETVHPRQRLASVPDLPVTLPPDTERRGSSKSSQYESSNESTPPPSIKDEVLHKTSSVCTSTQMTSMNGSFTSLGGVKENQEILGNKDAHAPSWLQLAQQRRELREQRERLLLGGSPNSFMDASNKPSRSSKVWDMVNNFQKLQMT